VSLGLFEFNPRIGRGLSVDDTLHVFFGLMNGVVCVTVNCSVEFLGIGYFSAGQKKNRYMFQRWVFTHLESDKNAMPLIFNTLRRHCSRFIFVLFELKQQHLFKYEGYFELTLSNSSDWIRHSLFNFGDLDSCTIPLSTDFIVKKIQQRVSGRNHQILLFGFDLDNKLIITTT
jgi:hypothetical protein